MAGDMKFFILINICCSFGAFQKALCAIRVEKINFMQLATIFERPPAKR